LIPEEEGRTYHYIATAPPDSVRHKVKKHHTKEAKEKRKERSRTEALKDEDDAVSKKAEDDIGTTEDPNTMPRGDL
jgi:hypothetical protein